MEPLVSALDLPASIALLVLIVIATVIITGFMSQLYIRQNEVLKKLDSLSRVVDKNKDEIEHHVDVVVGKVSNRLDDHMDKNSEEHGRLHAKVEAFGREVAEIRGELRSEKDKRRDSRR